MASASISGIEAVLELSTDGGSTWTEPSEVKDIEFAADGAFADVTNRATSINGSGVPFREQKKLLIDHSLSFSSNAIDSAMFDTLNAYALNLSSLKARFTIKEASGYPQFTGDYSVTLRYTSPAGSDVSTAQVTLTSAGTVAVADQ